MTDASQLADLRGLLARATPGPWKVRVAGTMTGRGPEVYAEGAHYDDGSEFVVADCGCSEERDRGRGRWARTLDADAIEANAHLIASLPALLSAHEALSARVAALERVEAAARAWSEADRARFGHYTNEAAIRVVEARAVTAMEDLRAALSAIPGART